MDIASQLSLHSPTSSRAQNVNENSRSGTRRSDPVRCGCRNEDSGGRAPRVFQHGTGSVVVPGSSHEVEPSARRGSCIESRDIGLGPGQELVRVALGPAYDHPRIERQRLLPSRSVGDRCHRAQSPAPPSPGGCARRRSGEARSTGGRGSNPTPSRSEPAKPRLAQLDQIAGRGRPRGYRGPPPDL
jgi:hypothetical protein